MYQRLRDQRALSRTKLILAKTYVEKHINLKSSHSYLLAGAVEYTEKALVSSELIPAYWYECPD